jgi:hypothetical protein
MQTILPAIVNAIPASQKRVKKIEWKKDNLRHVFDHGLSVEFSDTAKTAFLRSLVGTDSTVELTAGKSRLTLQTVGRVTRCHFHDAIGNGFDHFSVSYFSPVENLSFTEKDEKTREVIEHTVFGDFQSGGRWQRVSRDGQHVPPSILQTPTGADIDALRAWSKSSAWALLGENGLRAKAVENAIAGKKAEISRIASAISHGEHDMGHKRQFPFVAEIDRARDSAKHAAECAENQIAAREKDIDAVRALLASAETLTLYTSRRFDTGYNWSHARCENEKALAGCGVQIGRVAVPGGQNLYSPRAFFPAVSARYSVELVRANYTVKRGENGALVLSSGVVCPFNEGTALEWLRGAGPAPSTQYGVCRKIETCDDTGAPLVLIACGCHRIAVAHDLGGDFAELLKPAHKTELSQEKPALELNETTRAEFLARCEVDAARDIAAYKTKKAAALARYVTRKTELIAERDNLPAVLAEMEKGLEKAKAEKAKAENERAEIEKRFPGATLEKINDLARAALSAFSLPAL